MKKVISIILAMLILCFPVIAAERTDLTREEIPVAQTEANALEKLSLLKGTGNGLELLRDVTRAEAVVMIWRVTGAAFNDIGYEKPSFTDIKEHWAYDAIEKFYNAGYINGTSETTFEPNRGVTGKEFAKILLTVMGYENVTIENAYDKAINARLLSNNFTKTVVFGDYPLTRSDVARICFDSLLAKNSDGTELYKKLIETGTHTEMDFEGVLWTSDVVYAEGFTDRLNALMPSDKNYMFSPLSVKMAFALAANGANDETRAEILSALDIEDLDAFNDLAKEMIEKYSKTDILKLTVANSIWMNSSKTKQSFGEAYKNKIEQFYSGTADIVSDDNAVKTINDWVKDKTNGKISGIINNSDFWAMLVNAIYFKGAWQNEFSEGATKKDEFTDRNGEKSQIDFMNRTGWMQYAVKDGVQVVELPYKNSINRFDEKGEYTGTDRYEDIDVSMYIMLSDNDVSYAQILDEITSDNLLDSTYIALSLPKFKIEYRTELNDALKMLGIVTAFDENKADFKGMFDRDNMFISDVIHKTYIDVDEKGTEAAAVTAIGMAGNSLPPEPIEFKADKPFTFVIRDNTNGEILFIGEYAYTK